MADEELGARLKQLRKRKNLSIYDVERKSGIHFSSVSKYERNERQPTLDRLRELAEVYEVPVARILSDTGNLVEYLPREIQDAVLRLDERPHLSRLLKAADVLTDRQIETLCGFLQTVDGDADGREG